MKVSDIATLMGRRAAALLAVLATTLAPAIPAGQVQQPGRDFQALGREVVDIVRTSFYDSTRAGIWAERYAAYADGAESHGEFVALTRAALAALATSHTAYYTPADPGYYGLRAIFRRALDIDDVSVETIGADFNEDGFVRRVFAGSPAEKAGLRRGDRVIRAGGEKFERVLSFWGRDGEAVELEVRQREGAKPVKRIVTPRLVDPEEEWLEAQRNGARLIRRGGKKVAYVSLYSCAGEQYEDLVRELVADWMSDADALILDFRGGWGGCNSGFVDIFHRAPAVMEMTLRDGEKIRWDPYWRKPLYVLIDGGTRSGKEVVAYSIQKHGLGVLVGERTAGAVVAGRSFLLRDGALLYLAVADVTVDGERLEGLGVEPDVYVESGLRYADGVDLQLEAAIDLAIR
jgi:carboxyl-terminal processing protease